jgi:FkbM family methyltransferase
MTKQMNSAAPKAAITYLLVSNSYEVKDLELSLNLLQDNLSFINKYPIIVFHERLDKKDIDQITKSFSFNIHFEKVTWDKKLFDEKPDYHQEYLSMNCHHIVSTKTHMHPILDKYEYIMCLDPDSFIIGKMKHDPFVLMSKEGYTYSTINAFKHKKNSEYESCKKTRRYINERSIKPTFFSDFLSGLQQSEEICYSGFDILKLDFWRSSNIDIYSDFICSIDSSKESTESETFIPLIAASVFVPSDKVYYFKDIPYWYRGCISNFSLDIHHRTKLAIAKMKMVKYLSTFSERFCTIGKRRPASYRSEIGVFQYKGFEFYYNTEGVRAGLMEDKNWTYDEEITEAIVSELRKSNHCTFVDIGAHLGFITLNVVSVLENVKIYAFEPGPFQNALFERTIKANGLEEQVTLFKEALSKETGKSSFCCQELPDADWSMGNGLIDTKRGKGLQKSIEVTVETLDHWWEREGKPCVGVIKMDTEGAEYWILQGGIEFLSSCKPIIILEIQPLNLHAYPHNAKDVFLWLSENNYRIETMDGIQVTPLNFKDTLRTHENFIARHRHSGSG